MAEYELQYMKFRVQYRFNASTADVAEDWVCANLRELMESLEAQGVTKLTTKFLYVHYSVPGCEDVMEMIAWKNEDGKTTGQAANDSKTAKPRIKLRSVSVPEPIVPITSAPADTITRGRFTASGA